MDFSHLNITAKSGGVKPSEITRTTLIGNTVSSNPVQNIAKAPVVTFSGKTSAFSLSDDQLSRGTLIIGSTGTGKTNIFMSALDQIITGMDKNDVMFIFDSKGDFLKRYYRNPTESIVISASETHSSLSRSWNCFGELFDSKKSLHSAELFAREISKGLFKGMESSTQPFFHMAAADVFMAVMCCFCKEAEATGNYAKMNNNALISFIENSTIQDFIDLSNKYPRFRYIQSYLGTSGNITPQALGVLGYLYSMVNTIFVGGFRQNSPNGQFSIRRLMREKGRKIIFLEYDIQMGSTLTPIYSLFYDLAVKEALSVGNGRTYMIADEMNLLPHCTTFQDLVNFGRGRGCRTIIGLQSISQLMNNYGQEEGKAIAAGFLNSICLGAVDYDTRDFVSSRFGNTYDNISFGGMNIQREGRTVEECDIHNLGVGEAFVDLHGCRPFRFSFKKID